jgi:hypothetical protein
MLNWDERYVVEERLIASGTLAMEATIKATAVADNGDGTVEFECSAAHGLAAGSQVYIEGTTNYDGLHTLTAVDGAKFSITAAYVAETPAGSETVKIAIAHDGAFKFDGIELNLSAAPTTSESLTITKDSKDGAAYDSLLYSVDLSDGSVADLVMSFPTPIECAYDMSSETGDIVRFAWANTDGRTWGLTAKYRRLT